MEEKTRKKLIERLEKSSLNLRKNILQMVYEAGSGHIGGAFSIIDILSCIYMYKIKNDLENSKVILSKGHASAALYSILYEVGAIKEIESFRKIGGNLQGHPSTCTNTISVATGSLGQGLSVACGIALAKNLKNDNSLVYAILGDGEMQEGQVWEGLMTASKYELKNLTIIVDCNNVQLDGFVTDIKNIYPLAEKLKGFDLEVIQIDGHNYEEILEALDKKSDKAKVILAKTVKGKGVSFMENTNKWHGKAPNQEEYEMALKELEAENEIN